ncbi:MAG: hypothetical protein WA843_03575 [Candidatus Saccharimonadales bacterium]
MKDQNGFGLLEGLCAALVIGGLLAVGGLVYKQHHQHIIKVPLVTASKNVCFTSICLTYPSHWKESTSIPYTPKGSQPNPVTYGVDVKSPDDQMLVQLLSYVPGSSPDDIYKLYDTPKSGESQSFMTIALKAAPHFPGADIVEGVAYSSDNYTAQNLNVLPYSPIYAVVSDIFVKHAGLGVGQTTNVSLPDVVTRPSGTTPSFASGYAYFQLGTIYQQSKSSNGVTVGIKSLDAAKSWLQTANAKAAGQILQSVRPQ